MIRKLFYAIALSFSLIYSSCSIKEDRSACPCRLYLDFTQVDPTLTPQVQLYLADKSLCLCNDILQVAQVQPGLTLEVPRIYVHVNVHAGAEGLLDSQRGLLIPYGSDCPRLYSYFTDVDARGEAARADVRLRKNHCVMNVELKNASELDYSLCIKGNICGYGADGLPLEGEFSYTPVMDEGGRHEAVLPRQKDASLMLEVDDGSEIVKTFALGELIAAGGYDWSSPDLEDLEVTIDWAQTAVKLTIQGWDWVSEYEIII